MRPEELWMGVHDIVQEKAEEVVKKKKKEKNLLHEIIPRFGLPSLLQIGNGTSFTF